MSQTTHHTGPAATAPETAIDRATLALSKNLTLVIEPRRTVSEAEFRASSKPYRLAIDGYVSGAPWDDAQLKIANFNHHEAVHRFATFCTALQIHNQLPFGLQGWLTQTDHPVTVFANDPDQDVCTSLWLLKNHERAVKGEPLLNKLLNAVNYLDITAGLWPFPPKSELARQVAWVFEPYTNARQEGRIPRMSAREMVTIIEAVHGRIDQYLLGRTNEMELDTRYNTVGGGPGWKLVEEQGFHARAAFVSDGTHAFVSCASIGSDRYKYSIGRISTYIDFPLDDLYTVLNAAEGVGPDDPNRWGGGNTIGGSPRSGGSSLSPKDVEKIINEFLEQRSRATSVPSFN